jgi:hypothetical protein
MVQHSELGKLRRVATRIKGGYGAARFLLERLGHLTANLIAARRSQIS